MKTIQFESEVGKDGFLSLRVPLGQEEASARVMVTIEPSPCPTVQGEPKPSDWHEFVRQTYGSCAGLGLEEPEDLPLQIRETAE